MVDLNRLRLLSTLFVLLLLMGSCRVAVSPGMLEPDFYQINKQMHRPQEKVYVIDPGDTLQLLSQNRDQPQRISRETYRDWTFSRRSVDADVFTLPFKVRPPRNGLPAQLNSNFNAALYLGRRIDLFNYKVKVITPTYSVRQLQSRGFGYGIFAGVGSTAITDFVTRVPVGIEYEGVILDVGIATIYDARIFNIGLAVGVDQLMDQNRHVWIYQQRPWFGVLFGLNLN